MQVFLVFMIFTAVNAFQCKHFRDIYHESDCCTTDSVMNCLHETPSCSTSGLESNQICVDANNKRLIVAPKINRVLEMLTYRLDGTSVTSQSGTFTTPNMASITLQLGTIVAGYINYQPPAGTTQVLIRFFSSMRIVNSGTTTAEMRYISFFNVGGHIVTDSENTVSYIVTNSADIEQPVIAEAVIHIDPNLAASTTFATGKVKSWSNSETIQFLARKKNTLLTHSFAINNKEGNTYKPRFTITAIGTGY